MPSDNLVAVVGVVAATVASVVYMMKGGNGAVLPALFGVVFSILGYCFGKSSSAKKEVP